MAAARRVGVMGGTFDPIHCGHVDLGRAAVASLNLTQLLVLPSSVPPHRPQPHASSHHRFAMAAMTVSREPAWRVSDLEFQAPGPSYTTTTLEHLKNAGFLPDELFFVIGADAFAEVETWRNYPGLLDQAHFAVISRPGWRVTSLPGRLPSLASRMTSNTGKTGARDTSIFLIDVVTADVSSTAIRERCIAGLDVNGLVDPLVAQHIEQHGLYTPSTPEWRKET